MPFKHVAPLSRSRLHLDTTKTRGAVMEIVGVGMGVLQGTEARTNSRKREKQQKKNDTTIIDPARKRHLQGPISPTSKENIAEDLETPAPAAKKKRQGNEGGKESGQQQHPALNLNYSSQKGNVRTTRRRKVFSSASDDDSGSGREGAQISRSSTDDLFGNKSQTSTGSSSRIGQGGTAKKRKVLSIYSDDDDETECESISQVSTEEEDGPHQTKEVPCPTGKTNTQTQNDSDERPPKPHKALLYYQKRLGGELAQDPCSGTIKRVRLFNFMCHESFQKDWNPNLNFITGENGSGKSAVLSGIIVGLGARATSTSRTKALKSLIKTGKDATKIEITLTNHGALHEDKYGHEIIIQRVIDQNGVSTYKINDGFNSKFRGLKRTELDFILASFGIMLDNPVAILNQETARSFLKTKDPRDKYQFFFEGTSLGSFSRILKESQRNVDDAEENLNKIKELLVERKERVGKYEKLKAKLDEADRMEEIIDELTIEYAWSLVVAEESKLQKIKNEFEMSMGTLEKLQVTHDKLVQKKSDMVKNSATTPEQIEEMKTKLRNNGKVEQDIQREISRIASKATEQKGRIRANQTQISGFKETIASLEVKIEELSTVGQMEADKVKAEYEEKLVQLQNEKEEFEKEYRALKHDREQFQHGSESLRTQLNEIQDKEREIKHRVVRLKDELTNLKNKNSKVNKYAAFGRPMEELMAKIQANQHRFKEIPRGPLGACFTVKNEKWVRLIELILNNQLFDFVVHNTQDQNLLNSLIKQAFNSRLSNVNERPSRRPAVICNRAAFTRAFDVSRTKATTANHPTVLDMIEIENNDIAVLNTLIDSCGIERMLLFDSNKDACDLLKDRRQPNFPSTCNAGYTLEFYQITPDPRYRLEAKNLRHPNTFVKCSSAAQLRHLQRGISEAEVEYEELIPELNAKRKEENIFRKECNIQENEFVNVQRKLSEIKAKLLNLSKTTVKAPDVASFIEELNETKAQFTAAEYQKEEAVKTLQSLLPQLEDWKNKRIEISSTNEGLKQSLQELTDLHDHFQEKVEQIDNNIKKTKGQVREVKTSCDTMKPELENLESSVQEKSTEAEEKGQRVETVRSSTSLQQEVQEYRSRVTEAKELAGDRNKILQELEKAQDCYLKLKTEFTCVSNLFLIVANYVNIHVNYYNTMVHVIGNVLMGCFQSLIASRGYKGKLLIDHDKKELFYFVCPDSDSNTKTMEALKSNNSKVVKHYLTEYASGLSGGERSFATICYIISMWQIMESPFFMLDEFDVFMDPFNRKASQNALMSHANRFKHHQFFLFTPLELTEMKNLEHACILRMYPPVRNNVGNDISSNQNETDDDGDDDEPEGNKRRKVQIAQKSGTSSQVNRRRR